jgi:hypothetical protein
MCNKMSNLKTFKNLYNNSHQELKAGFFIGYKNIKITNNTIKYGFMQNLMINKIIHLIELLKQLSLLI